MSASLGNAVSSGKSSQSKTSRGGAEKAVGLSWCGAFRHVNKLPIKGWGWGVGGGEMKTKQNKTMPLS